MKIRLTDGNRAPAEAIRAIESGLDYLLSSSFKEFLGSQDGAKPDPNIFKIGLKNESGINRFIPISNLINERAYIENIPSKAYPVAWAEGGNYVFIDEDRNGAVFFWDHEQPEVTVELAETFSEFLNLLEPFDIHSVKLKPGQVKRIKVNPDLLKKFKSEQ
ncbi:MAG TPA: SMI1/KNR4 family protein [Opitutaceae bacterium]|nr:SMI1/KNR4 family protein [Opitutaceae bacterium]